MTGVGIAHSVKVKLPGERIWRFLRPDGGMTRLRLHAVAVTAERAAALAAEVRDLNPGVEARAVAP